MARSTDGGHSFKNYAWTTEPFRAYEAFMGDYTGIAALNHRIYGVWTEKPAPIATDPTARAAEARRPRNTLVKVGVADFSNVH